MPGYVDIMHERNCSTRKEHLRINCQFARKLRPYAVHNSIHLNINTTSFDTERYGWWILTQEFTVSYGNTQVDTCILILQVVRLVGLRTVA